MKNARPVIGGVLGAVAGFVVTLLLFEFGGFGDPADPIASGLLALVVFAPAGAIAGLILGTRLGMRWRDRSVAGGLAINSLRSFGVVLGLCAAVGGAYLWYALETATPWLNRNGANPILQFEVSLPAGAALPAAAQDVAIELQTDQNRMPGETRFESFRRDGDHAVIAGEVELAFRTAHRQLEIKIKGQPDRIFPIKLTSKAPHTAQLGAWQRQADGSEIRYRAKWAGHD